MKKQSTSLSGWKFNLVEISYMHTKAFRRYQDLHSTYTSSVHEYDHVGVWLQRPVYDYIDYSSRLVSTRKLVEDGSRDINN
jgi:hypothetical protein